MSFVSRVKADVDRRAGGLNADEVDRKTTAPAALTARGSSGTSVVELGAWTRMVVE